MGWAVLQELDSQITLIDYGHIKPLSKKKSNDQLSLRLNDAYEKISKLIDVSKPDIIVIEDYVRKFTKGRSSSQVIILLATFNEVVSLVAYQKTKKVVERIPAITVRSRVGKKYGVSIKDKDDVLKFVQQVFGNFKTTANRIGNIKEETYDEADAVITALGFLLPKK